MPSQYSLYLFAAFILLDIATGQLSKPRARTMNELGINLITMFLPFLVRLAPIFVFGWLLQALWPEGRGAWHDAPVWLVVVGILLIDDYLNYWLHRQCHNHPVLWNLHRAHHTPTCLNILVSTRTSTIYYAIIPVNALAPLLLHTGAYEAGAIIVALKLTNLYLQHAGFRWDLRLRRFVAGRLLLDCAESFLSLQDFHHAHHGIGRYGKGSSNYGNVFNL